ncbi:MAG: hypothetical protein PHV74_04845 [Dehalococcoidia bacterium]|nr:hypothetical protein [Dehalococcoidia bacterium]
MKNVEISVSGDTLTIKVALSQEFEPSSEKFTQIRIGRETYDRIRVISATSGESITEVITRALDVLDATGDELPPESKEALNQPREESVTNPPRNLHNVVPPIEEASNSESTLDSSYWGNSAIEELLRRRKKQMGTGEEQDGEV